MQRQSAGIVQLACLDAQQFGGALGGWGSTANDQANCTGSCSNDEGWKFPEGQVPPAFALTLLCTMTGRTISEEMITVTDLLFRNKQHP